MPFDSTKLPWILSIVAAALALTAAIVRYTADGELRWSLIAAAVFLLAFDYGTKNRMPRG
ncbi:MAG TPA: hypothetical protein VEK57_28040 [Thermoanaerobaculia bacterium]|nr:hypothetical protein [Thermoanaerobaculia bacterium]